MKIFSPSICLVTMFLIAAIPCQSEEQNEQPKYDTIKENWQSYYKQVDEFAESNEYLKNLKNAILDAVKPIIEGLNSATEPETQQQILAKAEGLAPRINIFDEDFNRAKLLANVAAKAEEVEDKDGVQEIQQLQLASAQIRKLQLDALTLKGEFNNNISRLYKNIERIEKLKKELEGKANELKTKNDMMERLKKEHPEIYEQLNGVQE